VSATITCNKSHENRSVCFFAMESFFEFLNSTSQAEKRTQSFFQSCDKTRLLLVLLLNYSCRTEIIRRTDKVSGIWHIGLCRNRKHVKLLPNPKFFNLQRTRSISGRPKQRMLTKTMYHQLGSSCVVVVGSHVLFFYSSPHLPHLLLLRPLAAFLIQRLQQLLDRRSEPIEGCFCPLACLLDVVKGKLPLHQFNDPCMFVPKGSVQWRVARKNVDSVHSTWIHSPHLGDELFAQSGQEFDE